MRKKPPRPAAPTSQLANHVKKCAAYRRVAASRQGENAPLQIAGAVTDLYRYPMIFALLPLALTAAPSGQPVTHPCIDLSIARQIEGEKVTLDVTIIQVGVHDDMEVRQDHCPNGIPILLHDGGAALQELVDLHVKRAGGVARARVAGIIEIPQTPPSLESNAHLNLRLLRVSKLQIVPAH